MPKRPARTKIAVAICTYKRNDALSHLLQTLLICSERVRGAAAVGIVVVDDTPEGEARPVAEAFREMFELGLQFRVSGRRNISLARNLALETAMEMAPWIAMTDDDCEPVSDWLSALLETQDRTGADAVTGVMIRRVPEGSPKWLNDEPFLTLGADFPPDGAEMTTAFTNNCLISSSWLMDHPAIRFDPALGRVGGEDMVFFRTARAAGLRIHYSKHGYVYENEPASRATLSYQLRRFLWHGNSSYVSSVESGTRPAKMFKHGIGSFARGLARPILRAARGESPQWRYCCASLMQAIGILIGPLGIRLKHR
jgi:succinoglycan biosynthesis protein ExoM